MKVGFIQTGAIGDILIALPAAKWYVDRSYDVFWPIDYRYIEFYKYAAPYINFLPVPQGVNSFDWHLGYPKKILSDYQVKEQFTLYSYLGSNGQRFDYGQPKYLPESLKLDEYKYAITNVPFSEKWNLNIRRNSQAEEIILESINSNIPYTIVHNAPAGIGRLIEHEIKSENSHRIIRVSELTPSPFDWIAAFEQATIIACEDSIHANLIEQLNITCQKYLFLRSPCALTPVFKNGWIFK